MDHRANYYQFREHGPKFSFPTQPPPLIEEQTSGIDQVIQSVKDVVTEVIQSIATEAIPTTTTTTTATTMSSVVEDQTSGVITEMQNNNSSAVDAMTNSSIAEVITEAITESTKIVTSTAASMDWMGSENEDYNLTMIHHHAANYDDENQTLYIILGVILGILVAIGFILLLIYISYKRSNLYSLQMQSQASNHSRVLEQENHNKGSPDLELAVEYDKSCYKF